MKKKSVIRLRDISVQQAKSEIMDFIEKRGKAFLSEISDKLKLDIKLVVDSCDELERDGLIKGTEDDSELVKIALKRINDPNAEYLPF